MFGISKRISKVKMFSLEAKVTSRKSISSYNVIHNIVIE